jgi:hypothetical protein
MHACGEAPLHGMPVLFDSWKDVSGILCESRQAWPTRMASDDSGRAVAKLAASRILYYVLMVSPEPQSESNEVLGDTELRASLEQVGRVTDTSSEDSFRLIVETIPGLVAVMTPRRGRACQPPSA